MRPLSNETRLPEDGLTVTMYVIIVGGGRVGVALAESLLAERHEVLVIERSPERAEKMKSILGSSIVVGDGCESSTLAEAGAERADSFIAVTEQDEDNLVSCQVARHRFHVGHIVVRINQPRNERIFRLLGFQNTVNAVESLTNGILRQLPRGAPIAS